MDEIWPTESYTSESPCKHTYRYIRINSSTHREVIYILIKSDPPPPSARNANASSLRACECGRQRRPGNFCIVVIFNWVLLAK